MLMGDLPICDPLILLASVPLLLQDLGKMLSKLPLKPDESYGGADQNAAMNIEPAALAVLHKHLGGRYNSFAGVARCEFHSVVASDHGWVAALPDIPLGLSSKWAGETLRSLLSRLSAPEDGVLSCLHTVDSKAVKLPAWKPNPVMVEPVSRENRGFTRGTVDELGHNCILKAAKMMPNLASQAAELGIVGDAAEAAKQHWPGGLQVSRRKQPSIPVPIQPCLQILNADHKIRLSCTHKHCSTKRVSPSFWLRRGPTLRTLRSQSSRGETSSRALRARLLSTKTKRWRTRARISLRMP